MDGKKGVTKPKELGKYTERLKDGGERKQQRGRPVEEVEVARKCAGCGKHVNKSKSSLVCVCKMVIHCNKNCQKSSSHRCQRPQENNRGQENHQVAVNCFTRYVTDREMNRGPSSEKMEVLLKRTRGDNEHLMVLAESGDPIAAYVVGVAYAERRACSSKGCGRTVGKGFTMPSKYLQKSVAETTEIAIKWFKIAAEGGVPEAMFHLCMKLLENNNGLEVDTRVAHHWLSEAHATGKMEYLIDLLESEGMGLAGEFENLSRVVAQIGENSTCPMFGPTLAHFLMATRWQELRDWGGKTAMGEHFYGRQHFNTFMQTVEGLMPDDPRMPCYASSRKRNISLIFIAGRPGSCDVTGLVVSKERSENNTKFKQGVKDQVNLDYQLCVQNLDEIGFFSPLLDRTKYLISCKHNEALLKGAKQVFRSEGNVRVLERSVGPDDISKYKRAGECRPCVEDALARLQSVAKGLYSISVTQIIPNYGYAARYVKEDGVIVQDIFKAYSKPDVRQVLQCLMSNPADLHPCAVAEDQNLFWAVIWYWGSVHRAVQETCNRYTVETVYNKLGDDISFKRSDNVCASALTAFPESAAGEWRIACGNEDCPRVDHEVKFNLCKGCKVRRYCDEDCQRKDWSKHKKFCKNAK